MKAYEYRHIVAFEETNIAGNVYYVSHLRWQGRCREMFVRDHAPDVVSELRGGLALATVRCSCEYLRELAPFDEIVVRMRLARLTQSRISFFFDYVRATTGGEELVATGEQQVACMRRLGDGLEPAEVPPSLRAALERYA